MNSKLNEKQHRFADEYLIDLNATQAAVRAGYSEKTAYSIGQRLLKNVEVRNFIDEKLQSKQDDTIADQNEVLRTLTRVLRREEKENVVVTLKSHKSSYDKNGKKKIVDEETAQVVEIPSKLSDVNKAAELLGKRYALWTDTTRLEGDVGVNIIDDIPESSQAD